MHHKIEKILEVSSQALLQNNKKLAEANEKIADISLKTQDNYPKEKFILQHFKDASNFSFAKDADQILAVNMKKYMECGKPMKALTNAFLSIIIYKDTKQRSIHGIDESRAKYMIKKNDIWGHNNLDEIMDQFIVMFQGAANNYIVSNLTNMNKSSLDKSEKMVKYLERSTTPGKVARKIYPNVKLDQLSYLKSLCNT